jgi:type IV secretion system protein VirD4
MEELEMLQKLLYLALCVPLIDLGLTLRKSKNKLATSRLGSNKDMGRLRGTDGLILSRNLQLNFKKTLEGVCVIAPTGEGKTSCLALPNLLSNHLPPCSLVISDPKGEQFNLTSEYQRSIGREPILFEPLGNHAKYNPREYCSDFTEVRNLATNLIINGGSGKSGNEWETMSTPLFISTLLHCKSISHAVKFLINSTPTELIDILGKSNNKDVAEQFKIFMAAASSPKTIASILSTLLSSLQLFTDHNLITSTSSSSFAPTDLRERPIALYIKYDVSKSNYLSPFLSVFFSQLIEKIMYSKGLPVFFILDEFQNLGRVPNFENVVATGRSEEVGFMICIQNISKLYDIYGKNNTVTILNNLKVKCVLPSLSDLEALEYLSTLSGDKDVPTESITGDKKTHSTTTKKLFTPDEIRRIDDNTILMISHNKFAMLDEQNYYMQPKYFNNIKEG